MGNPNLRLLLFVMARLPNSLHHAVYDLIDIPAFNPYVLHARFVVTCNNRLLDNHRGGCHHDRRLGDHYGSRASGFVYRRGEKPCPENPCPDPYRFAVVVMVVSAVVMARRRRRSAASSRCRKRAHGQHADK